MGTVTSPFNLSAKGSGSVGSDLWVDLGLIATGHDFWIGTASWSCAKATTFNLCTNAAGQSAGSTAATKVLWQWTSSSKSKSITQDLYQKGALHIATVVGTGVEHWWLHLTSTTSTLTSFTYSLAYAQE